MDLVHILEPMPLRHRNSICRDVIAPFCTPSSRALAQQLRILFQQLRILFQQLDHLQSSVLAVIIGGQGLPQLLNSFAYELRLYLCGSCDECVSIVLFETSRKTVRGSFPR